MTTNFEIRRCELKAGPLKTVGLRFIPQNRRAVAIFTHGYTSSKGDLLMWGRRLLSLNVETLIFDLPGHKLGGGDEVLDFKDFKENAHLLFESAFHLLNPSTEEKLILGGHSLGGILALSASSNPSFHSHQKIIVTAGTGLLNENETHPLERPFFKETFEFRKELLSESLYPQNLFPWVHELKKNFSLSSEKITLIGGEDDLISNPASLERLAQRLRKNNNEVSVKILSRLQHHEVALASFSVSEVVKEALGQFKTIS